MPATKEQAAELGYAPSDAYAQPSGNPYAAPTNYIPGSTYVPPPPADTSMYAAPVEAQYQPGGSGYVAPYDPGAQYGMGASGGDPAVMWAQSQPTDPYNTAPAGTYPSSSSTYHPAWMRSTGETNPARYGSFRPGPGRVPSTYPERELPPSALTDTSDQWFRSNRQSDIRQGQLTATTNRGGGRIIQLPQRSFQDHLLAETTSNDGNSWAERNSQTANAFAAFAPRTAAEELALMEWARRRTLFSRARRRLGWPERTLGIEHWLGGIFGSDLGRAKGWEVWDQNPNYPTWSPEDEE